MQFISSVSQGASSYKGCVCRSSGAVYGNAVVKAEKRHSVRKPDSRSDRRSIGASRILAACLVPPFAGRRNMVGNGTLYQRSLAAAQNASGGLNPPARDSDTHTLPSSDTAFSACSGKCSLLVSSGLYCYILALKSACSALPLHKGHNHADRGPLAFGR